MKWLLVILFAAILAGHFWYVASTSPAPQTQEGWASFSFDESVEQPRQDAFQSYLRAGNYWLGLSYALAGTFAAFCLARLLSMRREILAASAGGLTLSGVLWAGVCFMTGCCGSPMLPIYLGLFGSRFADFSKPLTFALTILSIGIGYIWMLKTSRKEITENVHSRLHEDAGADAGQV